MRTPDDFYNRFIEPIEDRMIRSVWRITRNAQDAEDAMQTALLVVWKRRDRVVAHAIPPALILKICVDTAHSIARRRARDRRRTEPPDHGNEPVDRAPSPWLGLARQEMSDEILAAIHRLSRRQAVAVTLRVFEELPYEQIAAAMDCAEATARKHVERALRQLRVVLAKHDPRRISRSER
ncbi:MAG TPA: RNA polymerase sigma factor [Chloroflexota bacterium]|jgi:RNA polymerase sigma factor (sigma-70 family)|nr:RNA polymerase sigma factor [Chloroflexota bacterium]